MPRRNITIEVDEGKLSTVWMDVEELIEEYLVSRGLVFHKRIENGLHYTVQKPPYGALEHTKHEYKGELYAECISVMRPFYIPRGG